MPLKFFKFFLSFIHYVMKFFSFKFFGFAAVAAAGLALGACSSADEPAGCRVGPDGRVYARARAAADSVPSVTGVAVSVYDNAGKEPVVIPDGGGALDAKAMVVGIRPLWNGGEGDYIELKNPIVDVKAFRVDSVGGELRRTDVTNCFTYYKAYSGDSYLHQVSYEVFRVDNLNPRYGVTYLYGSDSAFYIAAVLNPEALEGRYRVGGRITLMDGTVFEGVSCEVSVSNKPVK